MLDIPVFHDDQYGTAIVISLPVSNIRCFTILCILRQLGNSWYTKARSSLKEMTKQELKNLAYTTFVAFRRLIEKSPKLQSLIGDVWDGHNIGDTLYVIKEYAKDLHRRQKDSGYKSGTD